MKNLLITLLCIIAFQSGLISQSWETLANIPEDLTFPVVVALNGEIHVIGGGGPAGATTLHLRYKPDINIWDTLAPVPYQAQQPAGAVLNGKIHYFGGGYPNSGTPLSSHYVYNPSANTWSVAASLPIPRVIMEAASINGKIYALSGQPNKTRVDEYDPGTDSWTLKNPLPDNNFWYSAIVVYNNEIYRFGGGGYTSPVSYVHKYNAASDSWTNIANLPKALHAPAGSELGGNIYITGGYNGGPLDEVLIFDPVNFTFDTVNPLPSARSYHRLVTVDSCIYSIGGNNSAFPGTAVSLLRNCSPNNVSVKEINADNSIKVFPNPSSDLIFFECENSRNIYFELFDLMGKKKLSVELKDGQKCINISNLSVGVYFYRVFDIDNNSLNDGKIVVVR